MIDALRFEVVRMRTLRSTWWLIGAALVLQLAIGALVGYFGRDELADQSTVGAQSLIAGALTGGSGYAPLPMMGIFAAIIGAFTFGHEYFRKTITSTLAAVPRRAVLVGAKTLVLVVTSILLSVAGIVIGWAALTIASGHGIDLFTDGLRPVLLGFVAQVVIFGVLAMAVCLLSRSLPLTMAGVFVWPLVIETVISLLFFIPALAPHRDLLNYLPFSAAKRLTAIGGIDDASAGAMDEAGMTLLSRTEGGLVFLAWSLVVLIPGWILFTKRDA